MYHAIDLEQNFFGRQTELDILKKRVADLKDGCRQNVAVLGDPFVGKSSLLKNFFRNLDDESVIPVYLDLESKDFAYFFSNFVLSLLYEFSRNRKLPLHDDIPLLLQTVKPHIPQTASVVENLLERFAAGRSNQVFQGLLALPEIFTNETGKFCVLIIDEFQVMGEFDLTDVFQMLGKKIMTQKNCFYVVASSKPLEARQILSEKLSLLFGNFEEILLAAFSPQESGALIVENLGNLKIGMQLKSFLADFTGGYPLYLNLMCQELINISAAHGQKEVYFPILAEAVEKTIFSPWGVISRHFELVTADLCAHKNMRSTVDVLMAVSNGSHKITELETQTGLKRGKILQQISRFMECGILDKNGNHFYFKDKLFRYWIKYIFQRRQKDVALTVNKHSRDFKEEFRRLMDLFNSSVQKSMPDRIADLLNCFDNDAFDLNGRKYKLPLFQHLESVRLRGATGIFLDVIKAKSAEHQWFIVAKKDHLQESDVDVILQEARKNAVRCERCLIVSLAEMEDHVRTRALQERFSIWEEQEINLLLTMFDKPFISL